MPTELDERIGKRWPHYLRWKRWIDDHGNTKQGMVLVIIFSMFYLPNRSNRHSPLSFVEHSAEMLCLLTIGFLIDKWQIKRAKANETDGDDQ